MKYYKKNNEVFAFESDGSQDEYITEDMVLMTTKEIDQHINPSRYLTPTEQYKIYLNSMKPLTRRQFKLALLEKDLLHVVEQEIESISDNKLKTKTQIEYTEATEFVRTSESLLLMCKLLKLSEEEINNIWEYALTL